MKGCSTLESLFKKHSGLCMEEKGTVEGHSFARRLTPKKKEKIYKQHT